MYQYEAIVKKIVKDEILELEVDLGFNKKDTIRFRMHGIRLNGEKAKEKLKDYVHRKEVMIQAMLNKKARDNGDAMYLCVIYLPDDPHSINDRMVSQGYANRILE